MKTMLTSDEFGDISRDKIISIIKDRFGGIPIRVGKYRGHAYSKMRLEGLKDAYSEFQRLKIVEDIEHS
jgi:hypothetical protein